MVWLVSNLMENKQMTLDHLQSVLNEGKFHHATYRDHGTIWEGLWIYEKSDNQIGYGSLLVQFSKVDPDLDA